MLEVEPQKQLECNQAFEMTKATRPQNDGRFDLALYKKVDEANVFIWIEYWKDLQSLKQLFSGHSFRVLLGAIAILGKLRGKKTCVYMEEVCNGYL